MMDRRRMMLKTRSPKFRISVLVRNFPYPSSSVQDGDSANTKIAEHFHNLCISYVNAVLFSWYEEIEPGPEPVEEEEEVETREKLTQAAMARGTDLLKGEDEGARSIFPEKLGTFMKSLRDHSELVLKFLVSKREAKKVQANIGILATESAEYADAVKWFAGELADCLHLTETCLRSLAVAPDWAEYQSLMTTCSEKLEKCRAGIETAMQKRGWDVVNRVKDWARVPLQYLRTFGKILKFIFNALSRMSYQYILLLACWAASPYVGGFVASAGDYAIPALAHFAGFSPDGARLLWEAFKAFFACCVATPHVFTVYCAFTKYTQGALVLGKGMRMLLPRIKLGMFQSALATDQ